MGRIRPGHGCACDVVRWACDGVSCDRALAEALDINTRTVRQAMAQLVARGLVRRVRKAGTFVTPAAARMQGRIGFFYFEETRQLMRRYLPHMRAIVRDQRYEIMAMSFGRGFFAPGKLQEIIREKKLIGSIITPLNEPACLVSLRELEALSHPHIRLSNAFFSNQLTTPLVQADWARAIAEMLRYFRAAGHRRIGIIYTQGKPIIADLYNEYAASQGGFPTRWQLSIPSDGTLAMLHSLNSEKLVREYLRVNEDVTAVCATIMSRELVEAAIAMGRRVPRDLAVIAVGPHKPVQGLKLATMKVAPADVGQQAMEQLLAIIQQPRPTAGRIISIPFDYVEGDTFPL